MAQSNGHDTAETFDRRELPGKTLFRIGGKDIQVPALTLWAMEYLEPDMQQIADNMPLRPYSKIVLRIVATMIEAEKAGEDKDPSQEDIEKTAKQFERKIILAEMRELSPTLDKLLINSGYPVPGEAEATTGETKANPNPGMETSTESSRT